MPKSFYTTNEAAAALGVTSTRVRQMVQDGTMTAEKHGRDLLIFPEAIEQAKLRKTKPGPAAVASADDQGAASSAIEADAPVKEEKPKGKGAKKK